jgi:hypothetical protein
MRDAAVASRPHEDVRERNRRVLRVLLAIIVTLLVAGFLVGIRW